jgi:DNA-binding CsgD family transcriptional regulator
VEEVAALCHRGMDLKTFFGAAGEVVRRVSPYDGCCWFTLDPATFLPTSHIPERSIREEDVPRLAKNEYEEEDVNKFVDLARLSAPSGVLSEATGGVRESSARYREVLAPNGFENELRVTFMRDGAAWGGAAFYRGPDEPDFTTAQAEFAAAIAPYLAEGARRAILVSSIPTHDAVDGPGLILLDESDSVQSMTGAARRWMQDLVLGPPYGGELPNVIHAVVGRARAIAARAADGEPAAELARARIKTADGRWIVVHGAVLDSGQSAVMLEPARPPEVAPLIADAYGFTERERDVTQLVLQGLSTQEIGETLHLSPYTIQDHLKAIFEKAGVHSRRELVAEVFFRHYAPRMGMGENLDATGWFSTADVAAG